jgi:hypothetical protein
VLLVLLVVVAVVSWLASSWFEDESSGQGPYTEPDDPEQSYDSHAPWPPIVAFEPGSWWNTPIPDSAPDNPNEAAILDYLATAEESGDGCLSLAGASDSAWGQPVYWAVRGDPEYDVQDLPPESPPQLDSIRIPKGAQAADNSDGSMTVFDVRRGYVAMFTDARYDEDSDTWSASGGSVAYLDSNGLAASLEGSDDERNRGTHRGNNGAVAAVRWDEMQYGSIDHVLKVAIGPEAANRFVFPMTGSDGDYNGDDPAVPPQGLRLRIRPTIDLDSLRLHPQALVIAQALQTYGMYIGDSGGVTALKLEDTMSEGRGQLWDVTAQDLCGLPFDSEYWDVLPEGYDPS